MLSIVTPILNGVGFIDNNINSVRKLTIPYEHIIVDGGSVDGSLDIIRNYPELILLHQSDETGMYGAISMGFLHAKGKYICWINCDDQVIVKGFEKMYRYLELNNLDFVCSDGIMIDATLKKNKIVRGTRLVKYFLKRGLFPFLQPSTIYTKKLYQAVNGFDYQRFKIVGDMDLFFKMTNVKSAKFGYIPTKSTIFLKHGNSLGDKNSENAIRERKQIIISKPNFFNRILLKVTRVLHI